MTDEATPADLPEIPDGRSLAEILGECNIDLAREAKLAEIRQSIEEMKAAVTTLARRKPGIVDYLLQESSHGHTKH